MIQEEKRSNQDGSHSVAQNPLLELELPSYSSVHIVSSGFPGHYYGGHKQPWVDAVGVLGPAGAVGAPVPRMEALTTVFFSSLFHWRMSFAVAQLLLLISVSPSRC